MAKSFSVGDAMRLINEHRTMLQQLKKIQSDVDDFGSNISAAANALVAWEVEKQLREIPVEEINRGKQGIRTKILRDAGFRTLADLSAASSYKLSSVRGIGDASASLIKSIMNDLVSETRKDVKIRLSLDDKNPAATSLVLRISQYRDSQSIKPIAQQLIDRNQDEVLASIEALAPATGSIKWFFTSKRKKEAAQNAYNALQALSSGDYGKKAQSLHAQVTQIIRRDGEKAWLDFAESPIAFVNTLEEFAPGLLGSSGTDSVYGLPEELAREIQDECFFPDGLKCELRRYQEWGVKYILHQGKVLLGDEMGLGKTIQAIATMVSLKNTGAKHFLVVCPASVLSNWCREIEKHSMLNVTNLHISKRGTAAVNEWISAGGVGVTTYESAKNIVFPLSFRYSLLVVDEAHYIKNPETQRTSSVRTLSQSADRILFMTGTALENRVDEMVALISLLNPSLSRQLKGLEALSTAPRFRKLVAPVYYRRKREDVLTELPELIESKEWCSMNRDEELAYEDAVLSRNYQAARRVSWNVDDIQMSSKARRMMEIVEEAKSDGRKVIVFSFFLSTIEEIVDLLGSQCYGPINGSVPVQTRQCIIDEFDTAPAGAVLAAQIQSGGTGLNIQSASVVIICEPQFKPSIENQAVSRAYRMGQTRNVLVYRLLCENTIDERITGMLEEKQAIFDAFADESEAAKDSLELDSKSFGNMIQEEIDRINQKRTQGKG